VNISSYRLKVGDVVQVREKSRELTIVLDSLQKKERDIPVYLDLNSEEKSIKLVAKPMFSVVPYAAVKQPHLITEFYSR
jgi:small subunit ribosomal protein S4